jgi:hypothetical protein
MVDVVMVAVEQAEMTVAAVKQLKHYDYEPLLAE